MQSFTENDWSAKTTILWYNSLVQSYVEGPSTNLAKHAPTILSNCVTRQLTFNQLPVSVTMSNERPDVNDEYLALWRETFLRRHSGAMFDYSGLNVPLQNAQNTLAIHAGELEYETTLAVLRPETAQSNVTAQSRKVVPSSKNSRDLTLEEIFRDHDLQESSITLEHSMDMVHIDEGSNSDLSGLFDDDDKEVPLTYARADRTSSSNFYSSASSVDTADTNETLDDGTQRFKPFHEEKWNTRLKELLQYRLEYGDCLVPHTFNPNPQLARWVKRQRRQYKLMLEGRQSTMSQERLEILNEVNFVWDSHEAAWQEKLNELNQYRKERGNCLVPSNYKMNPQLATWVKCQRRQYKLYWIGRPSAMTPDRITRLEKMGFEWEIRSSGQTGVARSDFQYLSEAIAKMS
jgi:Helicase associated domain